MSNSTPPKPKTPLNAQQQELVSLVMTLFAMAFMASELGSVIDASQNCKTPRLILHALAMIITGTVIIAWAWLHFREKTK